MHNYNQLFPFVWLSYLPWFEVFYKLLNNLAEYLKKGQVSWCRMYEATFIDHYHNDCNHACNVKIFYRLMR